VIEQTVTEKEVTAQAMTKQKETKQIQVEVAYALPDKQMIIALSVDEGSSLYDAALASGITDKFPDLDIETSEMGIFGKGEKDPKSATLHEGDRVEIYRPLTADPKEVRKKRAEAAKQKREG
jgi:putative ubiquitin-RnfH superfamily antitoxin RatB of RatAB toxin-antitoxin module